jgi:peroxiredoxin
MHAYRDQYAQVFNGGRNVVLIAISTDSIGALASWARDDEFPFLMASDEGARVGRMYGAFARENLTNRNLFVVGPDGKIAHRAVPFREVDPTSYTDLGEVIDRLSPPPDPGG